MIEDESELDDLSCVNGPELSADRGRERIRDPVRPEPFPESSNGRAAVPAWKIVLIGPVSGKTCLIKRFVSGGYNPGQGPTLGCHLQVKNVTVDGEQRSVQLWDTSRHEIYRHMIPTCCSGADAVLLVFDLASRASFEEMDWLMEYVRPELPQSVTMMLIGNMADLEAERKIPEEEARAYADKNGMKYFETSAWTRANVEEVFMACLWEIKRKQDEREAQERKPGRRVIESHCAVN
jgi:small GTP-binding protein